MRPRQLERADVTDLVRTAARRLADREHQVVGPRRIREHHRGREGPVSGQQAGRAVEPGFDSRRAPDRDLVDHVLAVLERHIPRHVSRQDDTDQQPAPHRLYGQPHHRVGFRAAARHDPRHPPERAIGDSGEQVIAESVAAGVLPDVHDQSRGAPLIRGGDRLIDESFPLPAEHEVHGGEVDEGDGGGVGPVARKQQASEWRALDEDLAPSRRGRGGG